MKKLTFTIKKRAFAVMLIFAVVFTALSVRTGWIQFVNGKDLQRKAIEQQTKDSTINSRRGVIYDRNGKILAKSASVATVTVSPSQIAEAGNAQQVAESLAAILGMETEKVYSIITKNSAYEIVKRKIELEQADQIRALELKGVHLAEDSKRYYPYGSLASHTIGFVGTDNQGLNGVEMVFDKYLKGLPGRVISAKNARGTDMPFKYEKYINPENGANLVLTIDEVVQHFVEKHLEQAIADYKVTNGAACIIMNAKTGDILAMATKPDFDLNAPFQLNDPAVQAQIDLLEGDEKTQATSDALNKMWRNKAIVDTYEPGSTFKAITAAMALEEGVVSLGDTFNCTGALKVGPEVIRCWKAGGHGTLNFTQGVENSCNPVFMTIGARVGNSNFYKYFRAFGFTEKTGFDLPGEADSIFYPLDRFHEVELATASFGQGPTVTPLQMVQAYSALCNDGMMVRPRLAKELVDDDGNVIQTFDVEQVRQVISAETAATVRNILESVVSVGTSKSAYIKGYRVAGKTGTSEKVPRNNGKYVASFVGFAPANDPEIIGLLMLDEPMGDLHMGGQIAAPTFRKIFDDVLRYLNVEPQFTQEELASMDITVPAVEGFSKADAIKAFENSALNYRLVGDGDTVLSQIPKGGAALPEGSTVMLYTKETDTGDVSVPDVKGYTVSEANRIITNAGLNMKLDGAESTDGNSFVSSQSPAAGSTVPRGSVVNVELTYTDVH